MTFHPRLRREQGGRAYGDGCDLLIDQKEKRRKKVPVVGWKRKSIDVIGALAAEKRT